MENNLDKYFKDNLHERKFEMKDEYWLGAEKLLDEQDRRRKHRGLFWWFGAGLAVLSLVALGWWLLGENGPVQTTEKQPEIAVQNQAAGNEVSPVSNEENEAKSSAQSAQSGTAENASPSFPEGKDKQAKAKATTENNKGQNTLQSIDSQQDVNKSTRSLFSNPTTKNGQVANTLVVKPEMGAAENSKADRKENRSETTAEISLKQTENGLEQAAVLPPATDEEAPFERVNAPNLLALLTSYVEGGFGKKDLTVPAENKPIHRPKIHFGLMGTQMIRPAFVNGEQTILGYKTGIVIRYDLKGRWHLATGLQYQRRTGSFDASKLATARNYRFGLELDTLLLRPNSLHYLSVPLLLGWERNRHQFEGGLLLDFLTGVHGETGSYQPTGEPAVKVFKKDKGGWVSEAGYRRFTPTAQLGYSYQLNANWSLGLTANYTLGGILDKNFEPPLGGFLLKESDKLYLGLQAGYFIK